MAGIKFPKPKKVNKSTLKRKADMAFAKYIRSQGFCSFKGLDNIKCSSTLQCMHICGRANMRLRYDPYNCLAGCAAHHVFYTHNPFIFYETIQMYYKVFYDYINKHKNEKVKTTPEFYIKVLKKFG